MKIILSVLTLLMLSTFTFAQTTAIPDANFEQALINLGLDVGAPNGTVPTTNIDTLTVLYVINLSIVDLSGIEDFTALSHLDCSQNQLTSLNVTQNTAISHLTCSNNQLTSLDVTQNTALNILNYSTNQLTSVDITQNATLDILLCSSNQLTSLDVTQNTALTYLDCQRNQLTSLNVTQNAVLINLFCSDNQLTKLDITQNTSLGLLICHVNQLTCLNVKNGNNTSLNTLIADFNPNLNCITVDDVTYSTTNWTQIDAQTSFSTSCPDVCSTVGIEENTLSNLSIYPNPTTGLINIDLEETEANMNLRLINAIGQVILTKNYTLTNHINFDIDAPKGLYFLQLETSDGKTQTLKVIKE